MRALRRGLLVTTICVAVSVFLSAGVSHAKKGDKGGEGALKVEEEVEVELEPCGAVAPATSPCDLVAGTPPEPHAEGDAEHMKKIRNGVVKKDEFKGEVKIPIDSNSQLGIIDEAAAKVADIRLILSHEDGTDFAECRLAFDEIEMEDEEDEDGEDEAEYKLNVRIKKGAVQAKRGVCDVDLTNVDTTTGNAIIDSGVPDVQADDVATATLVDPTETDKNPADRTQDIDFLQDTFELH